jgi:hypothetical protein
MAAMTRLTSENQPVQRPSFSVSEVAQRLEPVCRDPFIDALRSPAGAPDASADAAERAGPLQGRSFGRPGP